MAVLAKTMFSISIFAFIPEKQCVPVDRSFHPNEIYHAIVLADVFLGNAFISLYSEFFFLIRCSLSPPLLLSDCTSMQAYD